MRALIKNLEKVIKDFRYEWFEDGESALNATKFDDGFDAIFLDLDLPKISGESIVRHLSSQDRWRNTPIFLLSGLVESEYVKNTANQYVAGIVDKNFPATQDLNNIIDIVRSRVSRETQANLDPEVIVGLGASAGGLEALQEFFSSLPEDQNVSFIVIQYLSPDFKSLMYELLSKCTKL
ncbi:MAG: response regulator [Pseudobacteriovorax sp.]|nr:response regulator [Pseudobacteriovorax sp.]